MKQQTAALGIPRCNNWIALHAPVAISRWCCGQLEGNNTVQASWLGESSIMHDQLQQEVQVSTAPSMHEEARMRPLAAGLDVAVDARMGMCYYGRWSFFAGCALATVASCLNMLGLAGESAPVGASLLTAYAMLHEEAGNKQSAMSTEHASAGCTGPKAVSAPLSSP